jgi:hypothetical protein
LWKQKGTWMYSDGAEERQVGLALREIRAERRGVKAV